MHMNKVPSLFLVLLFCELCSSIKVPVKWDDSARSEVKNEPNKELPVELIQPQNVHSQPPNQQPVPIEYFVYTAEKPRFAAEIAAFHGVQNPQQHYKSYPITPHTGQPKPTLGSHHMLDHNKEIYQPFQKYVQQTSELNRFVKPTENNYEVFHPYKAEEPALQRIYKDPVLGKIRSDIRNSKHRLQAYEEEAGEPNISKDEYLESPEKTDSKLFPHKNTPTQYEIHSPERRPVYYKMPPRDNSRDIYLNKKFKHPWNQNAKIRPVHYRPLKHHIHNLRQQHATKYDDERNEYPQLPTPENLSEPQEGHDIYEKGKEKFQKLRNNLDESVNNIVPHNRPPTFQKLELQNNEPEEEDDEDEFIPVKNYAQVRKTETYKHLPKKAAFDDAETYEEILNAPRLREAVKSTKAQTVYSEEGYEDSAYDHAGEQKHASDHEGHGGFLKEYQNSAGLYKTPTFSESYQDGKGSVYRDNKEHGKKWKHSNKDAGEETENEEYSEDEHEDDVDGHLQQNNYSEIDNQNRRKDFSTDYNDDSENNHASSNIHSDVSETDSDNNERRHKREDNRDNISNEHEVGKREVNFKVPEIDINSTLSFKIEDLQLPQLNSTPKKDDTQEKYPYYFKHLKGVNKNSPLKYAENLKLIPKKSNGGTEFYDSRSHIECSEVDEDVDPIPEKLKSGKNPDENEDYENDDESESKENKSFDTAKKQPRLKGLGDKIDCFKAKYFGENPLDSPFFKEEIIINPEPIFVPKISTFKLNNVTEEITPEHKVNNVIDSSNQLQEAAQTNIFVLLDKLRSDQQDLKDSLNKSHDELKTSLYTPQGSSLVANDSQQTNVYTDVLNNIKTAVNPSLITDVPASLLTNVRDNSNTSYQFFQNKEEVTKLPPKLRKKRATPFVYEPYKIIRDSQVQDSKKTTTTSNISPLIKQLQSSRVAERVSRSNKDDKQKTNSRAYVDIGRKERSKPTRNDNENADATIVDVSVDQRRGEPRYEIRPANHKSEYTPVENKRAMSVDAYKSHTTTNKNLETSTEKLQRGRKRFRSTQITTRPFHDLSQFIPKTIEIQNVAASNSIKNTVTGSDSNNTTAKRYEKQSEENSNDSSGSEEYEKEEHDEIKSRSTTMTPKPSFRRRIKPERSTQQTTTDQEPDHTTEKQLLKLVTRFRNYKPDHNTEMVEEITLRPAKNKHIEDDVPIPKYRTKKKKTHTSTLVTDTQQYGDQDDDEMKKEEVDALIGVKTNMDDYMPTYEKEQQDNESGEIDDDDDDEDDDDDDDDDNDDDDDSEGDDDEDEEEVEEDSVKDKTRETLEPEMTTPEPTKRTLIQTTDAPPTTEATHIRTTTPTILSRNNRPIITRKRTEIHKELPANKSAPHVTQFKQDIKEVEVIKEIPIMPKKKPQKNVSALDLYKDEELAKAINNLGDIEIFGEHIDLDKGPKHGGNYRKATKEDLRLLKPPESASNPLRDAETSQSKRTKHIELDEYTPKQLHGGNLKSLSDVNRSRNSGRSSKLIELSEPPVRGMHGGNLKHDFRRRGGKRNEKLIDLDENTDDDHSTKQDDEYKSRSSGHERMHGGNYRSAKIVAPAPKDDSDDIQVKTAPKNTRRNAAVLLNSFAQAVPILTSTPGYILDPSKRMYYYVD